MIKANKKPIAIVLISLCLLSSALGQTRAGETDVYLNHLYRARVFFHLGEYKKALSEYDQAKKIDSKDIISLLNKALIYKNMRLYKKAIVEYKKLLKVGQSRIILKNIGEVYYLDSNPDKAINSFNKALEIESGDASIYFWLGRCFEVKKEM